MLSEPVPHRVSDDNWDWSSIPGTEAGALALEFEVSSAGCRDYFFRCLCRPGKLGVFSCKPSSTLGLMARETDTVVISIQRICITSLHDAVSIEPLDVFRAFLQHEATPIVACYDHWDSVEPTIIHAFVDWAVPQLYLSIGGLKSCFVLQHHFRGAFLMHYCFDLTAHHLAIVGIDLATTAVDAQ